MKYLSLASSKKPFVIGGKKQSLRADRRSGKITARQQKKAIKLERRLIKESKAA